MGNSTAKETINGSHVVYRIPRRAFTGPQAADKVLAIGGDFVYNVGMSKKLQGSRHGLSL
jgi:hypothetical protein